MRALYLGVLGLVGVLACDSREQRASVAQKSGRPVADSTRKQLDDMERRLLLNKDADFKGVVVALSDADDSTEIMVDVWPAGATEFVGARRFRFVLPERGAAWNTALVSISPRSLRPGDELFLWKRNSPTATQPVNPPRLEIGAIMKAPLRQLPKRSPWTVT